jgi:hypothetical protein
MTDLWRRALGIAALGGGAVGATLIWAMFFTETPLVSKIIMALFLPMYVWGIWCGVQLLEQHSSAIRNNFWFWLIQIPILQSPLLGYTFSAGLFGGVWLQFAPAKINFLGWMGSRFELSINQPKPVAIGVNVVALLISVALWRQLRSQPSNNSFKGMPLRGTP